jgi:hypothetical protein
MESHRLARLGHVTKYVTKSRFEKKVPFRLSHSLKWNLLARQVFEIRDFPVCSAWFRSLHTCVDRPLRRPKRQSCLGSDVIQSDIQDGVLEGVLEGK